MDETYIDDVVKKYLNKILEKMVVEIILKRPQKEQLLSFIIEWVQKQDIIEKQKLNAEKLQVLTDSDCSVSQSFYNNIDPEPLLDFVNRERLPKESITSLQYQELNQLQKEIIDQQQNQILQIEKEESEKEIIKSSIKQIFIFENLIESELNQIVNAFEIIQNHAQQEIIKQGNTDQDFFYVVKEGQLASYKNKDQEKQQFVKFYETGSYFGEVQLIYNSPCETTIISITETVLYQLDKKIFKQIIDNVMIKKRQKYNNFLKSVDILSTLNDQEIQQISDSLKQMVFADNEFVIKEGDIGSTFYLIISGKATAIKTINQEPQIVYKYETGDYFGELSLSKDVTRSANIIANGELTLGMLDRESFERILGPIKEILQRNYYKYEKYIQ